VVGFSYLGRLDQNRGRSWKREFLGC